MSQLVEVRCTACSTPLKFRPNKASKVALNCPKCNHLFEVQVRQATHSVQPAMPANVTRHRQKESGLESTARRNIAENLSDAHLPPPTAPVRPIVRPATNSIAGYRKHNTSFPGKATVLLGIAGSVLLIGLVLILATGAGHSVLESLTANTSTPEGICRKRNAIIEDCLNTLSTVQSETDREAAAEALSRYCENMGNLVYKSARVESIDKVRRQTILRELQPGETRLADARTNLDRLSAAKSDRLTNEIKDFRAATETVKLLLVEVALELRQPTEVEEQICYDGLILEKRILSSLAAVRTAGDVEMATREIQSLTDDFNLLAQNQFKSGYRVSFPPRDYDRIEVAVESARRWMINNITSLFEIDPEFELTLDDFEYIQNRFDNALFKSPIVDLVTTSRQRVESELAQQNLSTQNDDLVQSNESPSSADMVVNEQPEDREDLTGAYYDRFQSESLEGPYGSETDSSVNLENRSPQGNKDFSGELIDPNGDSGLSQRSATDRPANNEAGANGQSAKMGNSGQPSKSQNLLSGPSSLTVRILNGESLDGDLLRRQMAAKIGARQSQWINESGEIVLNFEYSGSLQNASKTVDFGVIELSDSQSRTLFVNADE